MIFLDITKLVQLNREQLVAQNPELQLPKSSQRLLIIRNELKSFENAIFLNAFFKLHLFEKKMHLFGL